MNPKLLLTLALVLSSASVALSTSGDDTHSLRVIVNPSKIEVHIKEVFKVALRVENPTATNQTVRVMGCSWDEEWKTSNTSISWIGWDCTKNFARNVEIPPGGAYTNELQMLIPKPISQKTLSFRMGFTPIDSNETFWSDEVTLNILPPDIPLVGCAATPDPIDCLVTGCSSNGFWLDGEFPILGLPEAATIAQVVSKTFKMTGFDDKGLVKSHKIVKVRQVYIRGSSPDLYTAVLVQTELGEKILLLKYKGQAVGWWSRVFDL